MPATLPSVQPFSLMLLLRCLQCMEAVRVAGLCCGMMQYQQMVVRKLLLSWAFSELPLMASGTLDGELFHRERCLEVRQHPSPSQNHCAGANSLAVFKANTAINTRCRLS